MDGSRWDPPFLWDGQGRDVPGWWEHGCARQEEISGFKQSCKGEFRWIPAWKGGMVGRGIPGKRLDMAEVHGEHPGSVLRDFFIMLDIP